MKIEKIAGTPWMPLTAALWLGLAGTAMAQETTAPAVPPADRPHQAVVTEGRAIPVAQAAAEMSPMAGWYLPTSRPSPSASTGSSGSTPAT